MRRAAFIVWLVLTGCGQLGGSGDAGVCTADGVGVHLRVDGATRVRACAPFASGPSFEYLVTSFESGCADHGFRAAATYDGDVHLRLEARPGAFNSVGPGQAWVNVSGPGACELGNCFHGPSFGCDFDIMRTGSIGDRIDVRLSSPCELGPFSRVPGPPWRLEDLTLGGTIQGRTTVFPDDAGIDASCP